MTATQVAAQLKKWGIRYVEIPGWATHNRNSKGPWGPVNGFIWHHTGAAVSAANAKSYAASTLYNGLADLPGPLCQFSIGLDGIVYLVGWGRANHAGGGDPTILQHVIDENYTGQLKPTKGNRDGVDGNAHFYGVEIQYSGSKPMADAQYKVALRLSAAICDFHGWTERSVIAHGEWSNDKWDPGYAPSKIMAMPGVRTDVKTTLTAGLDQEDDVALTDAEIKKIAAAVWASDSIPAARPPVNNGDYYEADGKTLKNTTWPGGYGIQTAVEGIRRTQQTLGQVAETVDSLAAGGVDLDALAAKVAAAPGLADAIADRVAEKLAERLAD
jgi:hypothetical protein